MPAPRHPDSFEAKYHLLYQVLGNKNFTKDEMWLPGSDERWAINFRARFYAFLKAKSLIIAIARRNGQADTDELEAELLRVRKFKLQCVVRDNSWGVLARNRDWNDDIELANSLIRELEEIAKQDRETPSMAAIMREMSAKHDNELFEHLYGESNAATGLAGQPQQPLPDIPQNPAEPAGQTRDAAPGISLESIIDNTIERMRHGSIPRISLPLRDETEAEYVEAGLRRDTTLDAGLLNWTISRNGRIVMLVRNAHPQ